MGPISVRTCSAVPVKQPSSLIVLAGAGLARPQRQDSTGKQIICLDEAGEKVIFPDEGAGRKVKLKLSSNWAISVSPFNGY